VSIVWKRYLLFFYTMDVINIISWLVIILVVIFLPKIREFLWVSTESKEITLKDFVEKTVNDIEDAIKGISTRNGRQYHIRGSEFRWEFNSMWDIEFDISVLVNKENQIEVTWESWVGDYWKWSMSVAKSEKSWSTHRIKFAISCSQFDEISIARSEGLNLRRKLWTKGKLSPEDTKMLKKAGVLPKK
jgi:hypothetical protein